MKKCNNCGIELEDNVVICGTCGSDDIGEVVVPQSQESVAAAADINDNGNILSGVVGAFLFSLIGGLLYFIIYQFGFIAGISGLITFVLANFGYLLFARTKNKLSVVALIASVIMTFAAVFIAEYLCISYEIHQIFKEELMPVTFFEAVRLTPQFLEDPEVRSAFIGDIAMAYIFTVIASFSNVWSIIKARKNSK